MFFKHISLVKLISLFIINEANILWITLDFLFQESEPISNYLSSEVPQEVKQRIARMGVDTLLKMVIYNVIYNIMMISSAGNKWSF